jgi:thioredoxin-related protein
MKNLLIILPILFSLSVSSNNKESFIIETDMNKQPTSDDKIVFEMFFESHCGGCHTFITTQLKPLLKVKVFVNLFRTFSIM